MYSEKISRTKPGLFYLRLSPELVFIISSLVVNGGNYLYNMLLGRYLGPEAFAETGLIITLLLILSFLGMTFQIVTAKYVVELKEASLIFYVRMKSIGWVLGVIGSLLIVLFSEPIRVFFQASNTLIFYLFALSIPFYFVMSIRRGALQGKKQYGALSSTYQGEMWSRLLITLPLILLDLFNSSVTVAMGITLSIIVGYFMSNGVESLFRSTSKAVLSKKIWSTIIAFILSTVLYEFTQILINYADLLTVKHFMTEMEAGLYTSLSLVGRMIYFIAWMFVILLLPDVVNKKNEGVPHGQVLVKYVLLISFFSGTVVLGCFLFPNLVIGLLFGNKYSSIEPLLWKYALATSFFAISIVFIYYFLAINKYLPLYMALGFALLQLFSYTFFHESIAEVVIVQMITMGALVVTLVTYFLLNTRKDKVSCQ